jgi:NADH-quinone oxidoreductase subunit H
MLNRKILGIPLKFHLIAAAVFIVLLVILWGTIANAVGDVWDYVFDPDTRVAESDVTVCSESGACSFWYSIMYSVVLVAALLLGLMVGTLIERQFLAALQQRIGPNRVGPGGYLQPVTDMVKLMFKEDIIPSQVNKPVFLLAPILKAMPVLLVVAVIPFGPEVTLPWLNGNWYRVTLVLADINVGALWIVAITSLGTYGVVLAGWSSSNKYSMLGALRASAQMVSYELSMGLTLAVPIMLAGSMSVVDIVDAQGGNPLNWFVFQNPLATCIFMIALVAEVNRSPFDLPEAEQELTAGYMTEYGGMKFALFMLGEYVGMISVSLIAISMFFGGYHFFMVDQMPILAPIVLIVKATIFVFGLVWIRGTLPRLRYDRLMALGWKVMLPMGLVAVCWTAVAAVLSDELGSNGYMIVSSIMFIIIFIGALLLLDSGSDEDSVEDDPMITGENSGVAYAIVEFIGGIIAMPFVLHNATLGRFLKWAKARNADDLVA